MSIMRTALQVPDQSPRRVPALTPSQALASVQPSKRRTDNRDAYRNTRRDTKGSWEYGVQGLDGGADRRLVGCRARHGAAGADRDRRVDGADRTGGGGRRMGAVGRQPRDRGDQRRGRRARPSAQDPGGGQQVQSLGGG